MNQVSWSRILQNAENEGSAEADRSVVRLQDHLPNLRQKQDQAGYQEAQKSSLEDELQAALRREHRKKERQQPSRNQQRERKFAAQHQSFPAPEHSTNQGSARNHEDHFYLNEAAPSRRKSGSGAKNMLAILVSIAVVGFAFYQINTQWLNANQDAPAGTLGGAGPSATPQASTILVGKTTVASSDQNVVIEGNRLDMRPSLARESKALSPDGNTSKPAAAPYDNAQEYRSGSQQSKQAYAAASPISPSADAEQIMLKRGHEMIGAGHIEGARLIFEHLATQDSALGAFALAQTYDAKFLSSRKLSDAKPDQKQAAKWYRVAAELTDAAFNR